MGIRNAIQTTLKRGRIVVKPAVGRRFATWDPSLATDRNHVDAAVALATEYGWLDPNSILASGVLADGSYVHVLTPRYR